MSPSAISSPDAKFTELLPIFDIAIFYSFKL
jgi:hypothetical protein